MNRGPGKPVRRTSRACWRNCSTAHRNNGAQPTKLRKRKGKTLSRDNMRIKSKILTIMLTNTLLGEKKLQNKLELGEPHRRDGQFTAHQTTTVGCKRQKYGNRWEKSLVGWK